MRKKIGENDGKKHVFKRFLHGKFSLQKYFQIIENFPDFLHFYNKEVLKFQQIWINV